MSFADINELLDTPLPVSARLPQFWANTTGEVGHIQRESWRAARYNAFLIAGEHKVRFVPHGG